MWKQISGLFLRVVTIAQDTKKNSDHIKEIRQDLKELSELVLSLKYELANVKECNQKDKENVLISVENTLLRFQSNIDPKPTKKSLPIEMLPQQQLETNSAPSSTN